MKCYYHPNREIVATCTECGKGLCKECASKWEPTLCDDCAKSRISDKKIALKKSIEHRRFDCWSDYWYYYGNPR